MLQKNFTIESYEFILNYFDKELLDQQQTGRALAFCIDYKPKGFEREEETDAILSRCENGFLHEIYEIIKSNPEHYKRFSLTRNFDGGWTGGYNDLGQKGTIRAHRYLIMRVKELAPVR